VMQSGDYDGVQGDAMMTGLSWNLVYSAQQGHVRAL
jgi:hypothetical protein